MTDYVKGLEAARDMYLGNQHSTFLPQIDAAIASARQSELVAITDEMIIRTIKQRDDAWLALGWNAKPEPGSVSEAHLSEPSSDRCLFTKNLCGTDTWPSGRPCRCAACQRWLEKQAAKPKQPEPRPLSEYHEDMFPIVESPYVGSPLASDWSDRYTHFTRFDVPGQQPEPPAPFQTRVDTWMQTCFGPEISADKVERNHRFLEEALELVQATGCTKSEAHQLVDYVYGREQGDANQEVGGVMVTLAALCLANGLDMQSAGETELARVWTKIEKIRAKQAAKPKHSPLPEPPELLHDNKLVEEQSNPASAPLATGSEAEWKEYERKYAEYDAALQDRRDADTMGAAKEDLPPLPPKPVKPAALRSSARTFEQGVEQAALDVLAERKRQISVEGWTAEHDDHHDKGEMSAAAACYALRDGLRETDTVTNIPRLWPKLWLGWWKPKDRRRDLVRAGALIIAEIERLDRALAPAKKEDGG